MFFIKKKGCRNKIFHKDHLNPNKVLFQKDMTFGPFGKLQEANSYRKIKRERGFGTSDAPKRDEFTSNMVTEQYRGLLETEKMHQRRSVIKAQEVGKIDYKDRLGEVSDFVFFYFVDVFPI